MRFFWKYFTRSIEGTVSLLKCDSSHTGQYYKQLLNFQLDSLNSDLFAQVDTAQVRTRTDVG